MEKEIQKKKLALVVIERLKKEYPVAECTCGSFSQLSVYQRTGQGKSIGIGKTDGQIFQQSGRAYGTLHKDSGGDCPLLS